MSDIKLFKIAGSAIELPALSASFEKELQTLIEQNMVEFFGVAFLQSEYTISSGRIDSLGLDENNCPVIFEYKRSSSENVINQGLFYLDWLLDHKADFQLLVVDKLGAQKAKEIDWSLPSVICIASDFTKYDEHAINQMQRNIRLIRYRKYGDSLILFEQLNAPNVKPSRENAPISLAKSATQNKTDNTFEEHLAKADIKIKELYDNLRNYIFALGDDITENKLKLYTAYKKIKNIICAEVYRNRMTLFLRINPDTVELEEGFTRDMRGVGHYGTGYLQVIIQTPADFEKAKPLIEKAYNIN